MTNFCPLARLSCKVDFKPFLPVAQVAMCLMADFLNGSQPNVYTWFFGLLVRHDNLAFLKWVFDDLNGLRVQEKPRNCLNIHHLKW